MDQQTECHSLNDQVMDEWARVRIKHLVHFLGRLAYKGLGGEELMEADICIIHYVVGYGKAAGPGTTKHKTILSQDGCVMWLGSIWQHLMKRLSLFSDLFNVGEQRQDASASILLVGMAEFRYLAHVILLSFSGSKVCSRWLNYVEVVNIWDFVTYLFPLTICIPFLRVFTLKTELNCPNDYGEKMVYTPKVFVTKPFPWNTYSLFSWLKKYKFLSLFFKRVLPLMPINSHCLINTPKKVQHPDLFVGCDSEYNKIKANSFLFGFFSSIYSAQLCWVS